MLLARAELPDGERNGLRDSLHAFRSDDAGAFFNGFAAPHTDRMAHFSATMRRTLDHWAVHVDGEPD